MRNWTEEEILKLLKLKSEGNTINEIGVKLHRTKAAVKAKLKEHNATTKKYWTELEERGLVKFLNSGIPISVISIMLNRSAAAIRTKIATDNLFEKYPDINPSVLAAKYKQRKAGN